MMETNSLNLTKKQTEIVLSKHLNKENGLNDVLKMTLNAMMLNERDVFLKQSSNNKGNGYRLGKVFGFGAQLELNIPRDRLSQFQPILLAIFRNQESYLKEVSFKLYSKGLTTREISDVMETIYGNKYSKTTISDISRSFYEQMKDWRERPLDKHYLALYIDGMHVKLKRDHSYQSECIYIIMGLKEDYTREILAIVNFPTESAQAWKQVFLELKKRGLESMGILVSDGIAGLDSSITETFGYVPHQKCIVHLQRNIRSYVRPEDKEEVSSDLRNVLAPDDENNTQDKAFNKLMEMAEKWHKKYPSLSKYLKKLDWQSYFTYLNYHTQIRRMIYTTNWIERFNKSARRTLKIRGAFPDEESVLALVTSVAIEKSEKKYKYPIYNFKFEPKLMNPLKKN